MIDIKKYGNHITEEYFNQLAKIYHWPFQFSDNDMEKILTDIMLSREIDEQKEKGHCYCILLNKQKTYIQRTIEKCFVNYAL